MSTHSGDAGPDVSTLSYEQARDELANVVRQLESSTVALEESMRLWERGEALGAHCEAILAGALARLDATLVEGSAGPHHEGSGTEATSAGDSSAATRS